MNKSEKQSEIRLCEYCHREHNGSHGSGRFCSNQCSSLSRKKNRRKTIALKKKLGTYQKSYKPTVSNLQKNVSRLLSKAGIRHEVQAKVGKYFFDIKIGNVLLEVNGDYWHCNPQQYTAKEIVKFPGKKKKLVINVWKRDLKKKLQAVKKGYRVIYVWESEVNNSTQPVLLQKLIRRINNKKDIVIQEKVQ